MDSTLRSTEILHCHIPLAIIKYRPTIKLTEFRPKLTFHLETLRIGMLPLLYRYCSWSCCPSGLCKATSCAFSCKQLLKYPIVSNNVDQHQSPLCLPFTSLCQQKQQQTAVPSSIRKKKKLIKQAARLPLRASVS